MNVRLSVIQGTLKGKELLFNKKGKIIIGRSPDSDLVFPINENKISRFHCMIDFNPPNILLKDLDSLNGTFINGNKYGGCRNIRSPKDNIVYNYKQYINENYLEEDNFIYHLKNNDEITIGNNNIIKVNINYIDNEVLPGYERIKKIGESLLCEVYHVRKTGTKDEFALKLIKADEEPTEDEIRRLRERDAEIGILINHPNVVKQYKSGYENGEFYIVMDYVNGANIEDCVKENGKFNINTSLDIMLGILDGLEYLHHNGIIHRDIKPSNILLLKNKGKIIPKIIDFNLSILYKHSKTITKTGFPKGSLSYMPPEQITHFKEIGRNLELGQKADIFSLGATFYYMLTGKEIREFNIANYIEVILDQSSIIPINKRIPDIPLKISQMLEKTIAFKPENRFANIGEVKKSMLSIVNNYNI